MSTESQLGRIVSAVVLKGHWRNLLKPKIGSCVNSNTIDHALLSLSPYWISLSWSFFKWVETVPSYKHSLHSSWMMIYILTRQKHFKTAKALLEKIACKDFLSSPTVLDALVSSGGDIEVNSHVLSWLVIYYCNSMMNQDAIQVLEYMRVCKLKPHLHACTVLLNSLVKDKLTDKMWKMYKKMIKIGVVPNLHIYNVLIHGCCQSGDVEKAEELLRKMEAEGIVPDLYTYNTLISLYCKKGMHYEALSIQDRMKREGVSPDIITYNCLIHSYCREGRMREALRLLKEIKDAVPNHVTYTTIIDGHCRLNNIDEALRLLDEMVAKGLYPGVATYNSILRKLCEEGKMRAANQLLNEMSVKSIQPDNVTCNTLINAYCKIGDVSSALKVKSKMLEGGLRPDSFTYKALIHGFCKDQQINNAKEILFEMLHAGFCPGHCTYSWLVDYYCTKGLDDEIVNLLDELKQGGISVGISVFRAFIRRLCKREKVDSANKIFQIMQGEGIMGDSVIYTSLAVAYLRAGNGKAFSQTLNEMYKGRLSITLKLYRSINASYANDSKILDVCWSNMIQRGLLHRNICRQ